jgi:hypothetical protein
MLRKERMKQIDVGGINGPALPHLTIKRFIINLFSCTKYIAMVDGIYSSQPKYCEWFGPVCEDDEYLGRDVVGCAAWSARKPDQPAPLRKATTQLREHHWVPMLEEG